MTVTAQKTRAAWAQIQPRRNSQEDLKALTEGRPPVSGARHPLEPAVPLVLDGEVVEDLERFNATRGSQTLYTTRLSDGGAVALGAFTDRAAMLSETRSMSPDTAMDLGLPTFTVVWEDANQGGDHLQLEHGFSWPDLTRVHRGFLGTQDWNDIISSVSACQFDVILFADINFSGDQFFVPAGNAIMDLTPFGFNDLVSSFSCGPFD